MTGRQETYIAFAIVLASSLAYWLAVSSTPSGAPEDLVLEAITNQNLPTVRAHAELAAARALVEEARRYQRAAEQGSVDAQMTLGGLYAAGEGVAKDDAEAARWYRRAAEQGSVAAQARLADMFSEGRGVPRDQVQAHTWFNLAAARASGEDRTRYEAARDAITERLTSDQLAEAQRRAREWENAHPREP